MGGRKPLDPLLTCGKKNVQNDVGGSRPKKESRKSTQGSKRKSRTGGECGANQGGRKERK